MTADVYLTEGEAETAGCNQYEVRCRCEVVGLHGRARRFVSRKAMERAYYEAKGRGCKVDVRRHLYYRAPDGHPWHDNDYRVEVTL